MSVGTDKWVSILTIDHMRYACEAMDAKIKAIEEPPAKKNARCGGYVEAVSARRTIEKVNTKKKLTTCFEFTKNGSCPKPLTGLKSHAVTSTSSETCPI